MYIFLLIYFMNAPKDISFCFTLILARRFWDRLELETDRRSNGYRCGRAKFTSFDRAIKMRLGNSVKACSSGKMRRINLTCASLKPSRRRVTKISVRVSFLSLCRSLKKSHEIYSRIDPREWMERNERIEEVGRRGMDVKLRGWMEENCMYLTVLSSNKLIILMPSKGKQ